MHAAQHRVSRAGWHIIGQPIGEGIPAGYTVHQSQQCGQNHQKWKAGKYEIEGNLGGHIGRRIELPTQPNSVEYSEEFRTQYEFGLVDLEHPTSPVNDGLPVA